MAVCSLSLLNSKAPNLDSKFKSLSLSLSQYFFIHGTPLPLRISISAETFSGVGPHRRTLLRRATQFSLSLSTPTHQSNPLFLLSNSPKLETKNQIVAIDLSRVFGKPSILPKVDHFCCSLTKSWGVQTQSFQQNLTGVFYCGIPPLAKEGMISSLETGVFDRSRMAVEKNAEEDNRRGGRLKKDDEEVKEKWKRKRDMRTSGKGQEESRFSPLGRTVLLVKVLIGFRR
ncbi:uncharacterized protein LOC131298775 [Rhododendron vialii]|uniref:uncharacterized protein LOC131298775 n=1 Tax=Rhododendron vialii TaxID=182163 RepID=UPI00265DF818|nr:uncharacterized protein LOC131298775 [Rhododendron vialii]